ncbi:MAG: YciK family oxidoreductase [Aeromonadaceae bacterium]
MLTYKAPYDLLRNKIILVTGAGEGIGREAAMTYGTHGAQLILLGRTLSKLQAVQGELVAKGALPPVLIEFDLLQAHQADHHALAVRFEHEFSRLDGLLLNAGLLGSLTPIAQIAEQEWQDVLQVNLTSTMLMIQAMLPLLSASPRASVILTSSGVGRRGRANWGSYAVSKFATEGLMQVLADELRDTTIRVNCINPGATRTRMRAQACPNEDPATLKTAAEIMPLYLYLMGDESQARHGESLDAQPRPGRAGTQ